MKTPDTRLPIAPRGWTLTLILLLTVCGAGQVLAGSQDVFAKWLTGADGFATAMEQHQKTGRPLALYFYTDWCPYCRALNTEVLASDAAQQYVKKIVAVRINPEAGARERAISDTYGVTGYPTFFVLSADSDQAQEISAYRQKGNDWVRMTPSEFVQACETAGGKPRPKVKKAPAPRASRQSPTSSKSAGSTPPSAPPFTPLHPVTLYLRNGGVIDGDLVSDAPETVTLRLEYGEVVFERAEIQRLVEGAQETGAPPVHDEEVNALPSPMKTPSH